MILVGAYMAIQPDSTLGVGALVAFMMLGSRVASPLVGIARLLDDMNDVRASVGEVGNVLNQPTETRALPTGMRPRLAGAISLEEVVFTYPRAKVPALDKVSFDIPAGTMLGLVGRSGSGKSTVTRLLQGINREYSGYLKIDGVELREINLTHLRRNLGIVLQDNFLFRGTVRDNITAGRPGLTLEDVVRAARSGERGAGQRQPAAHRQGPDDGHRLPPPELARGLPPDRGHGSRQADRHRAARRAGGALLDLPPALAAAEPPHEQGGWPSERHHPGAGTG